MEMKHGSKKPCAASLFRCSLVTAATVLGSIISLKDLSSRNYMINYVDLETESNANS